MGRLKLRPYKEGSIKEILRLFFMPLYKYRPSYIDIKDWLAMLFCDETRSIVKYRATKSFDVLGQYLVAANIGINSGYRHITKDTVVWIRHDKTDSDRYDFEAQGRGRKSQVFMLTREEWFKVRESLIRC